MTDPVTLLWIWLGGTAIVAIILGAWADIEEGEEASAWFFAAAWPLVLVAIIAVGVISGPFWLGKKVRELLP